MAFRLPLVEKTQSKSFFQWEKKSLFWFSYVSMLLSRLDLHFICLLSLLDSKQIEEFTNVTKPPIVSIHTVSAY